MFMDSFFKKSDRLNTLLSKEIPLPNPIEKPLKWLSNHKIFFINLFMIIYFIAFPIFAYLGLLDFFNRDFLNDFKVKPYLFIITFSLIFIPLIFIKYYFIRYISFSGIKIFFKRMNLWVIITISFTLTMFLLIFSLYNAYTSYPLPLEGYLPMVSKVDSQKLLIENTLNPIHINCHNERGERDFIINKKIICNIVVNYSKGYNSYLNFIETTYSYQNNSQEPKGSLQYEDQINNLEQYWNIGIDITKEYEQSITRFYFLNESKSLIQTNELRINPSRIIQEHEYYDKKEKSFLLFMTAISILIFSTIASIKNFKDIWE